MSAITRDRAVRPAPSAVSRRIRRAGSSAILPLVVPALLVALWWWGSESAVNGLFIAPPRDVLDRTLSDFLSPHPGDLFLGEVARHDLVPSLWRAALGFWLAVVVGVGLGIVLGLRPVLAALFQPLVHLGRSLPTPALIGVFFLLFGTGDWPKVLLIAFGVVWPILFNTIDGVQGIGTARAHVASVFKIPSRDVLLRIVLPGAAPKIFAGVRVALSLSLIMMVISELQKAKNGLGYLLVYSQRNFDYPGFWTVLVVLAVVGIVLNVIMIQIERRVLAWHRGVTAQHD
ncbi:ABC transporter permease subunit [Nocardioides albidus]|uniref:ABC transporter permease subunit n=1 Tax=Nocardioides albidus TaxID=1517589 RepID=A0A5C4VL18_9ACTN|nr:ABC transporter permease subunit [Nocardioides albidus]TNM36538.1 ABC transporter permease subunit [Nocardioides albidus]